MKTCRTPILREQVTASSSQQWRARQRSQSETVRGRATKAKVLEAGCCVGSHPEELLEAT